MECIVTRYAVMVMFGDATTAYQIGEVQMTIFNDKTASPDEEAEMKQLKDGVNKAKTRLQEGREATVIEEEPEKTKKRGKKR